jgi:hypothetical protein
MTEAVDESLTRRTWRLLQPGEVSLHGVIVQTDLTSDDDIAMHEATVEVGELIAECAGVDSTDHYVYSGVEDPEFASNQHQGRRVEDDEFVWECQQLLRDGTFDLVFYYRAETGQESVVSAVREAGHTVTGVRGDASPDEVGES